MDEFMTGPRMNYLLTIQRTKTFGDLVCANCFRCPRTVMYQAEMMLMEIDNNGKVSGKTMARIDEKGVYHFFEV